MARKVPVEEFQKNVAAYVDSDEVLHLTRDGWVVGVYSPLRERNMDWQGFGKINEEQAGSNDTGYLSEEELDEILAEIDQQRKLKKAG